MLPGDTESRPHMHRGTWWNHEPARTAEHVDLALTGMSCAACAARIENTLNKLDGVDATVNFATEKASRRVRPCSRLDRRSPRRGRVDRLRRRIADGSP